MKTEFNQQIGARIREQREFLGLTREALCGAIGMSSQFLSEVERGVKGLSAETLCNLCNGLGVSADTILKGKEVSSDVSAIAATLATLDEKDRVFAEELLKTFIKAITLR